MNPHEDQERQRPDGVQVTQAHLFILVFVLGAALAVALGALRKTANDLEKTANDLKATNKAVGEHSAALWVHHKDIRDATGTMQVYLGDLNSATVALRAASDEVKRLTGDNVKHVREELVRLDQEAKILRERGALADLRKEIEDLNRNLNPPQGESLNDRIRTITKLLDASDPSSLQTRIEGIKTDLGNIRTTLGVNGNTSDTTSIAASLGTLKSEVENLAKIAKDAAQPPKGTASSGAAGGSPPANPTSDDTGAAGGNDAAGGAP